MTVGEPTMEPAGTAAADEPASAWDDELRELAERRRLVLAQGGDESVERQHVARPADDPRAHRAA